MQATGREMKGEKEMWTDTEMMGDRNGREGEKGV